jgi:CheY-like chemotaxis protein
MGLRFRLALSTQEALEILTKNHFAAIISDMGRKEGPREGYALLAELRKKDKVTPFFIYASSSAAEYRREGADRGAQGVTNRPDELVDMVLQALRDLDAEGRASKYQVDVRGAQGVQIGDRDTQTNIFGTPPRQPEP